MQRVPRRGRLQGGSGSARGVARHGDARPEQRAFVGLIFRGDPDRYWLHALETRGRLKIGALLATVQSRAALGTVAAEIDIRRERRRAVEAARRRHRLHEPRKARAGHVEGRPGSLRAGTLMSWMFGMTFAVGIVITALPVLAFAVHSISGPYSFA